MHHLFPIEQICQPPYLMALKKNHQYVPKGFFPLKYTELEFPRKVIFPIQFNRQYFIFFSHDSNQMQEK